MKLIRFKTIRITLLLGCLAAVAATSAHQREFTRNWNQTIDVTVFPINADNSATTRRYISKLSDKDFAIIDRWGEREAKRHNLILAQPFRVSLGDTVNTMPPTFPSNASSISVLFWGLKARYWAWKNTPDDGGGLTRVRMFVMYQAGKENTALQHSLGLQKGLIGLVHAFSSDRQAPQNNIVIAHELLHTVGALDKYDNEGNPALPIGFANPTQSPLFPQRRAEIMAGRIPRAAKQSEMAQSLRHVVINPYTATEINWIK
jgi:hypothetical protein